MSEYVLTKWTLTGVVGNNTPRVVIEELALTINLYYRNDENWEEFIYRVSHVFHTSNFPTVSFPLNTRDALLVALFINPQLPVSAWTIPQLEQALVKYWSYREISNITNLSPNFILGYMTPDTMEHSEIVDVCILYRYCQLRGLYINSDSSAYHMENLVRMDLTNSNNYICDQRNRFSCWRSIISSVKDG